MTIFIISFLKIKEKQSPEHTIWRIQKLCLALKIATEENIDCDWVDTKAVLYAFNQEELKRPKKNKVHMTPWEFLMNGWTKTTFHFQPSEV